MADLREMTLSNSFADYIFPYNESLMDLFLGAVTENVNFQLLNSQYIMVHLNNKILPIESLVNIGYSSVPSLFALCSMVSLEQSGILNVRDAPFLGYDGRGILVGFLDTGINYAHPAFLDENGRTRIVRIWDQTVESGTPPEGFVYGSEYTNADIDRALASADPYGIVPSRDEHGHGTLLAGIACGKSAPADSFSGAAPGASVAMVKLKEAKPYLRDYFVITGDGPVYQETDILLALRYLRETALRMGMPLVICIALGSNCGSHNGNTPLDITLAQLRSSLGVCIICGAGNEVGRAHHFSGNVPDGNSWREVEIRVPENTGGFAAELWGQPPEIFSIGAVSPLGEVVERIPARLGQNQTIRFVLERTILRVSYELVETVSGEQVILLRFRDPTPGIWRIRVYCSNYSNGSFHMWLPVTGLLGSDVTFLEPDPYSTVVIPGSNTGVITVAACDAYASSLYPHSGRGFTPTGGITPDITAPGVGITGPDLRDGYGSATGTGAAAALTAGACATILQWGLSRTPPRSYYTNEIKTFLIRGAVREGGISYPSREWGYGRLNVYDIFTNFLNP